MLDSKAFDIAAELDNISEREATASNPQAELDRQYIDENWYALSKMEARQVRRYLRKFHS